MSSSADEAITGGIVAALGNSPLINADEIRVYTSNGFARLQGVVATLQEVSHAMEIARGIRGVRDVQNDLVVSPNRDITDLDMQRCVSDQLASHDLAYIGARVEDGTVFLMGSVQNVAVEKQAMHTARQVEGVRDVLSELRIVAGRPIDDLGLADNVVEALSDDPRMAMIADLHVKADDGRVVMAGEVTDPKQVEIAEAIAESVPGVQQVDNQITVSEEVRLQ